MNQPYFQEVRMNCLNIKEILSLLHNIKDIEKNNDSVSMVEIKKPWHTEQLTKNNQKGIESNEVLKIQFGIDYLLKILINSCSFIYLPFIELLPKREGRRVSRQDIFKRNVWINQLLNQY